MNGRTSTNDEDLCLATTTHTILKSLAITTHTILKSNKFFSYLVMREINVSIIFFITNIIKGCGKIIILLPKC